MSTPAHPHSLNPILVTNYTTSKQLFSCLINYNSIFTIMYLLNLPLMACISASAHTHTHIHTREYWPGIHGHTTVHTLVRLGTPVTTQSKLMVDSGACLLEDEAKEEEEEADKEDESLMMEVASK